MMYYVYILRCADNSLYCGITNNLEKRLNEHNSDGPKGAKYLRTKRPVTIVYTEKHPDRSAALKREYEIKQLSKSKKESLVATSVTPGVT
jgi:putative endonuclease